jgi:Ni,Fe-hydrogenase III small subunit
MFKILKARLHQKHRTLPFPSDRLKPVERFRGYPQCMFTHCSPECHLCVDKCPTSALIRENALLCIDLGKCLFCNECSNACPNGKISFTNDYRCSASKREDLIIFEGKNRVFVQPLEDTLKRLLGRSLKLRQVSAGGCNACEADTNVLGTPVFDLARFGIQFVASPRHADGILVTGPVTENMHHALLKTYEAVPDPKIVIAVGACAISGGPFQGNQEVSSGLDSVLPVDLYIPGCPPHPLTILDGLLRIIDKLKTMP